MTTPSASSPAPAAPLIGGHVLVAGGLATGGLKYAAQIEAEVVQVFVTNPRGWALAEGRPAEDAALRESPLPVFIHTPYLVNVGSPSADVLEKSLTSIRHALRRGVETGALGVVVHTGSAVSRSREEALRQVREHLLPVLEEIPDDGPDLLLEPMAGQANMLCATVQELGPYLEALEFHPRANVCLDTCHAFAAGHDLAAPGGVALMMDALHAIAPGRLKLLHANDSKDPCGSGRDRHENIGAGQIGAAAFGELMRHPASAGVPLCIETPGKVEGHRADILLLKSLRDAALA
ncbi:putative endonuclease 4 [Sphaerisporangium krabiense]|uniref:Probable endonuclease 4 n=1 Tax=Sphaerisporangium krabiense TaxID=763782 RepID=A0A7W8Z849_9ACTN|nr:deoxyribonuclease IV [Sphaerisporangium krabiense]MBB5629206.1 deoxyribonuclease-4 [Sphaerisporangium krabiense]GII59951.1 putative endonuclease 4 [Sphaerisporangium krabiense]